MIHEVYLLPSKTQTSSS